MATYTLYEYYSVDQAGSPILPQFKRTIGLAFGAAQQLADDTIYFRVIPDVDARFLSSTDGTAATSADEKIYADVGTGAQISPNINVYIYLTAA